MWRPRQGLRAGGRGCPEIPPVLRFSGCAARRSGFSDSAGGLRNGRVDRLELTPLWIDDALLGELLELVLAGPEQFSAASAGGHRTRPRGRGAPEPPESRVGAQRRDRALDFELRATLLHVDIVEPAIGLEQALSRRRSIRMRSSSSRCLRSSSRWQATLGFAVIGATTTRQNRCPAG